MGFDFSSYLPPPPGQGSTAQASAGSAFGALPQGITSQDIPQLNSLMYHPVDNPDSQNVMDGDGNVMGSMKDLNPSGYATQKAQWDEQQKLMNANLLHSNVSSNSESGNPQVYNQLGTAAPASFSGHDSYTGVLGTNKGEGGRLVYTGGLNDSTGNYTNTSQKLLNKDAVYNDPTWGQYTTDANINKSDGGWDTFWKIAPLIPSLIAGGVGMFGLAGAGGATAGDIAAGADTGGMFGTPLAAAGGSGATASFLPAALARALPNAVKGTIQGLNSNGGKLNPLGLATSLVPGALGLPSWVGPLANAGIGLAQGGGFDFSKYLPMGLQTIAKGLG